MQRVATKFTLVIGFITLGFIVTWYYSTSIGGNEYSINVEDIHNKIVTNFTFLKLEHLKTLEKGLRKQVNVEFSSASGERTVKNDITLKTVKPKFPKEINLVGKVSSEKTVGYIRVWEYWEQMTMNTVALISLAGQAKIGDRKVLAPKVENSWFGQKRKPLETYFNMTYFNTLLTSSNYATLVDEENYNSNCSLADASHVTIHFVYEGGRNEKQDIVGKLAGKLGWAECRVPKRYSIKEHSNAKYFCVDANKVTEWDKLEKQVIHGARCVTITNWRGIGRSFRTQFTDNHLQFNATRTSTIRRHFKGSKQILSYVEWALYWRAYNTSGKDIYGEQCFADTGLRSPSGRVREISQSYIRYHTCSDRFGYVTVWILCLGRSSETQNYEEFAHYSCIKYWWH